MSLHQTRIKGLGYVQILPTLWRFIDQHDGINTVRHVGPPYKTEKELLADLDRYARDSWGYGATGDGEMKDYLVTVNEDRDGLAIRNVPLRAASVSMAKDLAISCGENLEVLSVYEKVA